MLFSLEFSSLVSRRCENASKSLLCYENAEQLGFPGSEKTDPLVMEAGRKLGVGMRGWRIED